MVVPKFEISFAASDFVLDTLVLIVPIPSVRRSALPFKLHGPADSPVDLAFENDQWSQDRYHSYLHDGLDVS